MQRFYTNVTRYTTSAFLHMKFGAALGRRGVAPHIFESRAEAEAHLRDLAGRSHGQHG
jgi:propionate CoA-transferase